MTVIQDIAARLGPAVVGVHNRARGGSGVVVAPGVVATLARNVRGDEVRLATTDGHVHAAEVLGIDPSTLYRKLSRFGVEA